MTKNYRQGQILKLIRTKKITTQEELPASCGRRAPKPPRSRCRGTSASWAWPNRRGYREILPDPIGRELHTVLEEFLLDVRLAQNLLVLKTSAGNANSLAVALDSEDWPEVAGTVAGDDTIFVACWTSSGPRRCRNGCWSS